MKNVILVVVVVACLAVAGLLVFKRGGGGSGGIDSIPEGETILTLCMACDNTEEMNMKEYYKQLQEKQAELMAKTGNPQAKAYLTCSKCGKDAVTEAMKCEKCGTVFRKNAIAGDYGDRCPKCKYSPTEARYKERTGG